MDVGWMDALVGWMDVGWMDALVGWTAMARAPGAEPLGGAATGLSLSESVAAVYTAVHQHTSREIPPLVLVGWCADGSNCLC